MRTQCLGPPNANGTGASLQLIDPLQDNWRVGNWSIHARVRHARRAQQCRGGIDPISVAVDQ